MEFISPLHRSRTGFAKMLGNYGEEAREAKDIRPVLRRARESGKCALINVWVDPEVFSPDTMHETMYKQVEIQEVLP
jgi:acetolactate synthase-1/2/3 large subunit